MLEKNEKALVIGAEVLSRVADLYDKDSMLYADGAGATLIEKIESEKPTGILSYNVDCGDSRNIDVMNMGESNNSVKDERLFFKMNTGHDVFKYALRNVPKVIKKSIDDAKLKLKDIKKILIHQANGRMDEKIVENLFRLYNTKYSKKDIQNIMPMTISWLGNSSVATIPTLLDRLNKNKFKEHSLKSGDNIVFASIGAGGPNINSFVYRVD